MHLLKEIADNGCTRYNGYRNIFGGLYGKTHLRPVFTGKWYIKIQACTIN